jgi:Bacterial regulatory proteins, luxR family
MALGRHTPGIGSGVSAAKERFGRGWLVRLLLRSAGHPSGCLSRCGSRKTVKTHLRSIYQKLGVASRSEAIERAVDLRLL